MNRRPARILSRSIVVLFLIIFALSGFGATCSTASASPITQHPYPPRNIKVYQNQSNGSVLLTWQKPYFKNFTEYHVYRSEKAGNTGFMIKKLPSYITAFRDNSVIDNLTYFYLVRTYRKDLGESVNTTQAAIEISSQTLLSQSLKLKSPAFISIPSTEVSAMEKEATITSSPIEVIDSRNHSPPLGWRLTIKASDFTTPDGRIIPVSGLKAHLKAGSISGKDRGLQFPSEISFRDSLKKGESEPVTLLSAPRGSGLGHFKISPIFTLRIPAFSIAGNYEGKLTFTLY